MKTILRAVLVFLMATSPTLAADGIAFISDMKGEVAIDGNPRPMLLSELTKDLGRKIIITGAVVNLIGERYHFDPLGTHKVKGHSPVEVWGIRTARTTPEAVEAEAVT